MAPDIAAGSAFSNCWRSARRLRELILQKRSNAELKAAAQKTMMTMHQDALQKAAAGITSLEEILRVSSGDLLE